MLGRAMPANIDWGNIGLVLGQPWHVSGMPMKGHYWAKQNVANAGPIMGHLTSQCWSNVECHYWTTEVADIGPVLDQTRNAIWAGEGIKPSKPKTSIDVTGLSVYLHWKQGTRCGSGIRTVMDRSWDNPATLAHILSGQASVQL